MSELGADDTSRNIIEIIFQSSWLKKQSPVCKVDRILKVHNTPRTLARFEEYRDAVKAGQQPVAIGAKNSNKATTAPTGTRGALPTATSCSGSTAPPWPARWASTAPRTSATPPEPQPRGAAPRAASSATASAGAPATVGC